MRVQLLSFCICLSLRLCQLGLLFAEHRLLGLAMQFSQAISGSLYHIRDYSCSLLCSALPACCLELFLATTSTWHSSADGRFQSGNGFDSSSGLRTRLPLAALAPTAGAFLFGMLVFLILLLSVREITFKVRGPQ